MKFNQLGIGILLIGAFSAPVAMAAPISYMINFTLTSGGPFPTVGGFTYDPDAASNQFSFFQVGWDGAGFDLSGNIADYPSISSPAPACLDGNTGAAASFAVLNGSCMGSAFWRGDGGNGAFFGFDVSAPDGTFGFFTSVPPVLGLFPFTTGIGGWTITPTPEPSSFVPGTIFLAFMARKRITQRRQQNR